MIFETRLMLEEYSLLKSRSTYLGGNIALCNVLGDMLMYVDTRDMSLAPHLMHRGVWESPLSIAIGRYIKKDMYCLDIGANFGYYTLLMANLGANVVAFEPNKRLCMLMKRSININGYDKRVVIHDIAVADSTDTVNLSVPMNLLGTATIMHVLEDSYSQECYTVKLDDCIEKPVDFIKCDVEGADILVWKGMQKVWETNRKLVLCIECQGDKELLYDSIAEADTKIRVVNGMGNIVPSNRDAIINSEYLDMLWVTHA